MGVGEGDVAVGMGVGEGDVAVGMGVDMAVVVLHFTPEPRHNVNIRESIVMLETTYIYKNHKKTVCIASHGLISMITALNESTKVQTPRRYLVAHVRKIYACV